MAQRKYCKNTVPGRQGRGKKYPAKVRAEVVMTMISANSICAVARKYGVPESTIRSWMAEEAKKPDGVFAEARAQAAREIAAGRRWEPGPRWVTCSSGWPRTSGQARSAQSCGQGWTRTPGLGSTRSAAAQERGRGAAGRSGDRPCGVQRAGQLRPAAGGR